MLKNIIQLYQYEYHELLVFTRAPAGDLQCGGLATLKHLTVTFRRNLRVLPWSSLAGTRR
jgi:hypothetical protein